MEGSNEEYDEQTGRFRFFACPHASFRSTIRRSTRISRLTNITFHHDQNIQTHTVAACRNWRGGSMLCQTRRWRILTCPPGKQPRAIREPRRQRFGCLQELVSKQRLRIVLLGSAHPCKRQARLVYWSWVRTASRQCRRSTCWRRLLPLLLLLLPWLLLSGWRRGGDDDAASVDGDVHGWLCLWCVWE